jgi:hypothetical protein
MCLVLVLISVTKVIMHKAPAMCKCTSVVTPNIDPGVERGSYGGLLNLEEVRPMSTRIVNMAYEQQHNEMKVRALCHGCVC